MKKNYFFYVISSFLFLCISISVQAQERTITGKVTDSGEALPGVNVLVTGTSVGTVTDVDGNYTIAVTAQNTQLTFSSIGYISETITIGNQSVINIDLVADVTELSEVVVTALGVERDVKALNYSVTDVAGENFTQARENSIGNALAGRIAGVNVSNVATGPAGSSRVIIRGIKTLNSENQPLYVVDGIPMDNSQFGGNNGQAGMWGGGDSGNGLTSLNPDDIESITVLKGAAAAALYGSRGGNGVINIVTKRGAKRQGLGIEFNTNVVAETVNNLSDLQQSYGAGNYVNGEPSAPSGVGDLRSGKLENSWGPRLGTGSWFNVDGVERPNTYAGDNWDRFYETGLAITNSLAITGGGENQTFRFSASDLRSNSVIPNSGFDRTNLSLSTDAKFAEKLTLNAKVMYSHEEVTGRPRVSDSPGNAVQAVWRRPPNVNIDWLKGDPNKLGAIPDGTSQELLDQFERVPGQELLPSSQNNWGPNPWWVAEQHLNDDTRDRIITSSSLRYDITDFLYVSGRVGLDWFTRRSTSLYPEGSGDRLQGGMTEGEDRVQEINMEWMLGFNKQFEKIGVNAFVGGNRMRRQNEQIQATGNGFNVPGFAFINNAGDRNYNYGFGEQGINSIFGSAEISYNGIFFLTGTVRNDWFSTLNPENNSILYPSVGATFVFSDAFETLPNWLSFGKFRASWGQVGIVTINPYDVNLTYSLFGNTHLGRPMASFSSAQGRYGLIPNPDLIPATSQEFEVGFDVRLFDDRLGIDFAYYKQNTFDDIVSATIPLTTGFGTVLLNVGELENTGIELLLSGTPIRGDVTWDVSLNFATNNNKVISLVDGVDFLGAENSRTQSQQIRHVVGSSYGDIYGTRQQVDENGNLLFESDGRARQSDEYEYLGSSLPDWTGGLNNSITWKGINLSFLIDIKVGSDLHSGTNQRLTEWGLHKQSLIGREGEAPLVLTGRFDNGSGEYGSVETRTLTPDQARNYWQSLGGRAAENFMYDAGFGKLRQLTLGYSLPSSILNNTPFQNVTLSFVGRNLAILWKNVDNIDPEASYSSNGGAQGLDYFGFPSTRSYGFNLRLQF